MADFTLRPLTVPERKYTYAQSSQLQGQTGNIGYLRGDFGSSGDQFYTTWFDTRPQWKSDEFKRDLRSLSRSVCRTFAIPMAFTTVRMSFPRI